MRRWNGWGDESIVYPLPQSALRYLNETLDSGLPREDALFEDVVANLPASKLPAHPLVHVEPDIRLKHARGQSLPDWIALRCGKPGTVPAGVAFPESTAQVRDLLQYANEHKLQLIPYGGGTSVVGHVNPLPEYGPALTVSMRRLNGLIELDKESHLATFEAGVTGPEIESSLGEHGYTLGHFPQSWEYSTLGGWIATRSSGQQSFYYGRIEDLLRGAALETPSGKFSLPLLPASAAGPDLLHFVLGSEGRIGLITQATVRVRPRPALEQFLGAFFPTWEAGVTAAHTIAQERVRLSMLRLSDSLETETTLALAGHERLLQLANWGLTTLGHGAERCLMIYGFTGDSNSIRQAHAQAHDIFRSYGGLPTGKFIGRTWEKSRFRSPYLRNTLWERGFALDTLETAVPWASFNTLRYAVLSALRQSFEAQSVRALVFSHLSHIYEDGVSFYVTYLYPRQKDPDQTLAIWSNVKAAASQAIVNHGGTISHQHGVGLDHRAYLLPEKSALGMDAIKQLLQAIDPHQILNPGKLLALER
jgi:alkyldihydroxyacetonephosphate synthase